MARIWIIDDDVELSENLAAMLETCGHEVKTTDSTDGALEQLSNDLPDLLIQDVMFPENPVAGFDLARKLRNCSATKELPIILLTGLNQEFPMSFSDDDIHPEWMPVQGFLEKPVDLAKLKAKVEKILAASEDREK